MVSPDPIQFMALPCRDVTSWNLTDRCHFVRSVPSCEPNAGFIDYLEVIYCLLGPEKHLYTLGMSVVWLLMLFVALGITSGDFLTPALFVISKTLHIQGSYELVIGGLIGGGIFVTTVVAGSVFLTQPFKLAARPFLRDCLFYTSAGVWAFYLFYTGSLSIAHAIGFICLYGAYILLVVVSGILYQKYICTNEKSEEKEKKEEKSPEKGMTLPATKHVFKKRRPVFDDPERSFVVPIAFRYVDADERRELEIPINNDNNNSEIEPDRSVYFINLGADFLEEEVDVDTLTIVVEHPLRRGSSGDKLQVPENSKKSSNAVFWEVVSKLISVNIDGDVEEPFVIRLLSYFKIPMYLVLAITTPVVDITKKKNNWCRPLNALHCITAPVFVTFALGMGLEMAGGVVPIVAIVAAVGAILGSAVLLTSKNDEAPKYHSAFAYAGFFVGVVWIYVISMEIVVLLQAVGLVFNISDTILGLTILAWGNGLLDFLANLNIARKGYPRMSISACFGTPCLTLLLGVGIPSLVQLAGTGNVLVLQYSKLITVLFSGLAASLVSSLVTMTALKFHSRRFYGGYLLALYFTFLVIAVLVESEFI
ncbi:mitochondrial sodium/calcium exchanger protein [Ixodes scapularis]